MSLYPANIVGCHVGTFPKKYLWMPLELRISQKRYAMWLLRDVIKVSKVKNPVFILRRKINTYFLKIFVFLKILKIDTY